MPSATSASHQPHGPPLGGANGNLRHRLLHFHVPLALASTAVIVLWMSLPLFQASGHQGPAQAGTPAAAHVSQTPAGGHATGHPTPETDGQTTNHQSPTPADGANPPTGHHENQTANPDANQNRLFIARFTTATGYVALGLLGLTLLIGPANLLLRRRTPISSYLTRDVGTWAAIISVVHVIAGFFVHGPSASLGERILYYFFAPDGTPLTNTFGWGNWTGLAATVIVVGLLAISSDFALRKLQASLWKNLQRLNYALFAFVVLHALYYGALSRLTSITTFLLGLIVSLVFIGQMVGIWLWRRKHFRAPVDLT